MNITRDACFSTLSAPITRKIQFLYADAQILQNDQRLTKIIYGVYQMGNAFK